METKLINKLKTNNLKWTLDGLFEERYRITRKSKGAFTMPLQIEKRQKQIARWATQV